MKSEPSLVFSRTSCARFLDRRFRRKIFSRVFDFGEEPAVGYAFGIEDQESGGRACPLRRRAIANDLGADAVDHPRFLRALGL